MTRRTITLTVDIDADHMLASVADALARTLAGLVLDGYGVQLDAATVEVDVDEGVGVGGMSEIDPQPLPLLSFGPPRVRVVRRGSTYRVQLTADGCDLGHWCTRSRKRAERLANRKLAAYLRKHEHDGHVLTIHAEVDE